MAVVRQQVGVGHRVQMDHSDHEDGATAGHSRMGTQGGEKIRQIESGERAAETAEEEREVEKLRQVEGGLVGSLVPHHDATVPANKQDKGQAHENVASAPHHNQT